MLQFCLRMQQFLQPLYAAPHSSVHMLSSNLLLLLLNTSMQLPRRFQQLLLCLHQLLLRCGQLLMQGAVQLTLLLQLLFCFLQMLPH